MTSNNHPRLFFVHIPKCAGMTLHAIIERQYEPEQIYTVPSCTWNDKNYQSLCNEWHAEDKARLRVVKGHIDYGWHRAFGDEPYEYITILRHPVERALSLYSFIKDWHADYSHKQAGIEAFIRRATATGNDMTNILSGGIGREARAFVRAWQNLLIMPVVGTVEAFDRTLQVMRGRYGWPPEAYDWANQTPDRVYEIPGYLIRRILYRNQYDMMLYAYAQRRQGQNL